MSYTSAPTCFRTATRDARWAAAIAANSSWWQQMVANAATSPFGNRGGWRTLVSYLTTDSAMATQAYNNITNTSGTGTVPASGVWLGPTRIYSTDRNELRERLIELAWMFDWLTPLLSQAQRDYYVSSMNYQCDYIRNHESPATSDFGSRTNDSDQLVGTVLGMLAWASVCHQRGINTAKADELLLASTDCNGDFLGGLTELTQVGSTPVGSRGTYRNTITKSYFLRAVGGSWIETSHYNTGTLQLLFMGADALQTVTGTDYLSQLTTPMLENFARNFIHEVTPNLSRSMQWLVVEQTSKRTLELSRRVPVMYMLAGMLKDRGSSLAPYVQDFANDIIGTTSPDYRMFLFGDQTATATDHRTGISTTHYANGMGILYARDVLTTTGDHVMLHAQTRPGVDHSSDYASHAELYFEGEQVLSHPILTLDGANQSEVYNSALYYGLSAMSECKVQIGADAPNGGKYAYLVGGTLGNRATDTSSNPPRLYCDEGLTEFLTLWSNDGNSAIIVRFDRIKLRTPLDVDSSHYDSTAFPRIDAAVSAGRNKEIIWHVSTTAYTSTSSGAAPTLVPFSSFSWDTSGGKHCRVSHPWPTDLNQTVIDEQVNPLPGSTSNGAIIEAIRSELKKHVRLRPQTIRKWDHIISVYHVVLSTQSLTNYPVTLVQSTTTYTSTANGGSYPVYNGVLLKRPSHNNVLVMGHSQEGPDLAASTVVSGKLVADTTLPAQLNTNSLRTTNFAFSWNPDAATDLYLTRIDPTVSWTISINGAAATSLPVSSVGLAQKLNIADTGGTMTANLVGGTDITAPTISAQLATSLTTTSERITCTTSEAAEMRIDYGIADFDNASAYDGTFSTSQSRDLTGLQPGTIYQYTIFCRDAAGNETQDSVRTFTTQAINTGAPVISNLLASQLTSTSERITFTTDKLADTYVEWGLTTSYGTNSGLLDTNPMVLNHSYDITGLTENTQYFYKVTTKGTSGG